MRMRSWTGSRSWDAWRFFGVFRRIYGKSRIFGRKTGYDIITYATGRETQGQPVICAGILTDRQGETWTMRVLDGADVHGDILLRGVEGEHAIAEIVQVTGTYDTFEHVRNPGGFQSRSYYLARNISGYYYAPQVTTITVDQRKILGLPKVFVLSGNTYII